MLFVVDNRILPRQLGNCVPRARMTNGVNSVVGMLVLYCILFSSPNPPGVIHVKCAGFREEGTLATK